MTAEEPEIDYERLYEKVGSWPAVINNSMITIHTLKSDKADNDPLFAIVVHNPFDVRQYQVLAILPTLDMEIAVTNGVKESADQIVRDTQDDDDLQHALEHMMIRRLTDAAESDREFAHKAIDAKFDCQDLAQAAQLYQEHYGLTNGGDFNRPLY